MDSDEGNPGYIGSTAFLFFATTEPATIGAGWSAEFYGIATLVGGVILALVTAHAKSSLSRLSRPRLLQRLDNDPRQKRMEKLLADHEEIAALTALLKLMGMGGAIAGFIFLLPESTVAKSIWSLVALLSALLLFEILPVAFGRRCPESVALRLLPIVALTRPIFLPLIRPFLAARVVVLRALGVDPETQDPHEELAEEIMAAVEDQERPEPLADDEREWIENIVDLKETMASAVLTPRTDIIGLEVDTPFPEALAIAAKEGHSRLPVYEERLDVIVGIFYVKDVLPHFITEKQTLADLNLRNLIRKPFFVPETKKIQELLKEFRARRLHMAIVLDEYGGTAGVVTIEDILEEIVGEIEDEFDSGEEEPIRVIEPGTTAEVDGRAHVEEVNEALDINLPEDEDYETIGGFVCSVLGRIPTAGESFDHNGTHIKIIAAEERSVTKLRIDVKKPAPEKTNGVD